MVVPSSLRPVRTAAALLGAAFAAWILLFARMRGMDDGPGTDLGGLGWFLGVWLTMTAAMMFPSVAPAALLFAQVRGRTPAFLAGYVAAWTAYGLAAYGLFRLLDGAGWLAWDRAGAYVAGGAVLAAGVYQLTPLKNACLRRCRNPLGYVMRGRGALTTGAEHGLYCVGCCWALMAALFALGVMSLFWMGVLAAVIFVEKVLPRGETLSRLFSAPFLALGLVVAVGVSL
jgi:predicted metal-binding membrane protein